MRTLSVKIPEIITEQDIRNVLANAWNWTYETSPPSLVSLNLNDFCKFLSKLNEKIHSLLKGIFFLFHIVLFIFVIWLRTTSILIIIENKTILINFIMKNIQTFVSES